MKMKDVFELPLRLDETWWGIYSGKKQVFKPNFNFMNFEDEARSAISAINNHDKLTEEVRMCNVEASNIALWLFNKFFFHKTDMAPLELCDSPSGIMTQIDNMSVGILEDMNKLTEENARLKRDIAFLLKIAEAEEDSITKADQERMLQLLKGDEDE